jgi:ketosteroid isomerase-like protein
VHAELPEALVERFELLGSAEGTLSATAEDGSAVDMAGDATVVSRLQPDGTWRLAIDDPGWITT